MGDEEFPTQMVVFVFAKVKTGPGVTVTVTGVLEVSQPVKVSVTETYKVVEFPMRPA